MQKTSRRTFLLATTLLPASLACAQEKLAAPVKKRATGRVAIFAQAGFPQYGMNLPTATSRLADDFRAAGLPADLLDVDALSNADKFNASLYDAVVLPYGNTYPYEAFGNLKAFHRAGGSLITTGIPFTHGVARMSAKGWTASPEWGSAVQLAPGEGPKPQTNAIRIENNGQWAGVSSSRFPVKAGDTVTVSAQLRALALPRSRRTSDDGIDNLFVRFFDANDRYLEQHGPELALSKDWTAVQGKMTVPNGATVADVSLQIRKHRNRVFVADIAAEVNGQSVTLPNADFSARGDGFLDLGHDASAALWGKNGIGIGGFAEPDKKETSRAISSEDPFHLKNIRFGETAEDLNVLVQWVNTKSLPSGVKVIPAIGTADRPFVALIVHEKDAFQGAVDAWVYRVPASDREDYETRQLLLRGTVAALSQAGLLTEPATASAWKALDALPRPEIYANLSLPTPARTYSTFQPKMPPLAPALFVVDLRGKRDDDRVFFLSLQGIVNRKQPRVYFISDDADAFWLEELQRHGATGKPLYVTDPWSLVDSFRTELKGAVIPDPNIFVSPCVAVCHAGRDDLLIATPAQAEKAKLAIGMDLRGKFKDNAEALRYIRTELAPGLDPYLTCSLTPDVFNAGAIDQIIAARGSLFWITGPRAQDLPGANQLGEMAEVKKLLASMPLGAVVRGFWWHGDGNGLQEDEGVAMAGRFGKITLVTDLITNLSVHSGVKADKLTQKPRAAAPKFDKSKVYVCFTMSDGDNLCTWREYFRRYYNDPVRGTFPVGWGMSPAIIDLAPAWARWYYENATSNDEFFCDVSGVAYIYPPTWGKALKDREGAFKAFYDETETYLERMDMNTVRLMNVNRDDIARVGKLLPKVEYLLPDYGHAGMRTYPEHTYDLPTGQAVFRAATNGSGPQNLANQIRERAGKGRPAFLNAFIWNWGSSLSDLKQTIELLGPEFVPVTPSQLNALYREAHRK